MRQVGKLKQEAIKRFRDVNYRLMAAAYRQIMDGDKERIAARRRRIDTIVKCVIDNDLCKRYQAYFALKKRVIEHNNYVHKLMEQTCKRLIDKNYDLELQAWNKFRDYINWSKTMDKHKASICKLFLDKNLRLMHQAFRVFIQMLTQEQNHESALLMRKKAVAKRLLDANFNLTCQAFRALKENYNLCMERDQHLISRQTAALKSMMNNNFRLMHQGFNSLKYFSDLTRLEDEKEENEGSQEEKDKTKIINRI